MSVGAVDKVLDNEVLPGKVGYPASGEPVTVSPKAVV